MEESRQRRKRGPSALGNFDQSKAVAQEAIRERRDADQRKTQRLRELRMAEKPDSPPKR